MIKAYIDGYGVIYSPAQAHALFSMDGLKPLSLHVELTEEEENEIAVKASASKDLAVAFKAIDLYKEKMKEKRK